MTTTGQVVADVGKSGIRIAVTVAGRVVRTSADRGVSTAQQGNLGCEVAHRLSALVDALGAPATVDSAVRAVVVGANIEFSELERAALARVLLDRFRAARLAICDDGTLAHGAILGDAGTLLAIGTGVIAITRTPDGTMSRLDGWGPLAGDRGGATDLGRHALVRAFQHVDEGQTTGLRMAAEETFGPLNATTGRNLVLDPLWPERLASFVPQVAALGRQGDPEASELLAATVQRIITTAKLATTRATVPTVAVSGRFGHSEPVWSMLCSALTDHGLEINDRTREVLDLDADTFINDYESTLDVRVGNLS